MKSRNILLVAFLLALFLCQKRQAAPWASAARQLPALANIAHLIGPAVIA
jgi:hypothetical protein